MKTKTEAPQNTMRRGLRAWALLGLAVIAASASARATVPAGSVPTAISYEGQLTDANGNPLNGTESMVFSVYNAASGGSSLWQSSQAVTAANGGFSTTLSIPVSVLGQGTPLYLDTIVNGTELTPRMALESVAYALIAKNLEDGVQVASFTVTATLTAGNVTASRLTFSPGYAPSEAQDAATKAYVDGKVVSGGGGPWTQSGAVVDLGAPADNVVVQSTLTVEGRAFSVGGSTFVVAGGRLGVGTASPSASLDVNGSAQFGSGAAKSTFSATTGGLTFASSYAPAKAEDAATKGYVDSVAGSASGPWQVAGPNVNLSSPTENVVIQSTLTVKGYETVNGDLKASGHLSARGGVLGSAALSLGSQSTVGSADGNGLLNVVGGGYQPAGGGGYVYTNTRGASRLFLDDGELHFDVGGTSGTAGSAIPWIDGADIQSSGNAIFNKSVGVGTSSPGATLDVKGSAQFGSSGKALFASTGSLTFPGSYAPVNGQDAATKSYVDGKLLSGGGPWKQSGSVVDLTASGSNVVVQSTLTVAGGGFSVGGSTLVVVAGKVGIGTTAPGQRLSVAGTVESTSGGFKFPDGSVQTSAVAAGGAASFSTMTITQSAVVGGGAPVTRLTVQAATAGDGIWLESNGTANTALLSNAAPGSWNSLTQSGDNMLLFKGSALDSNSAGGLVIGPWSAGATGLRITPKGKVGLGIAKPSASFQLSSGEVGIGQQNDPTPYLRLGMDSSWTQYLANNAFWTGSQYDYVNTGGYAGMASRISQISGSIGFDTANGGTNPIQWSNRLTIANNGYIGIGTSAPNQQLSIAGSQGLLNLGGSGWDYNTDATRANVLVDSATYKALMIVGNNVAGNSGKGREVKVWDYLNVQGSLNATDQVCLRGDCRSSWPSGSDAVSLRAYGNANPASGQGAYLGWNALTGGTGETDFVNNEGSGSGGFAFFNTPVSGSPLTPLMTLTGAGDLGLGTTSPSVSLDVVQNGAIKVGQAYLSSGGDFAHLSNNEWFNGGAWQQTAAGELLQLTGQQASFYSHDASGNHVWQLGVTDGYLNGNNASFNGTVYGNSGGYFNTVGYFGGPLYAAASYGASGFALTPGSGGDWSIYDYHSGYWKEGMYEADGNVSFTDWVGMPNASISSELVMAPNSTFILPTLSSGAPQPTAVGAMWIQQ